MGSRSKRWRIRRRRRREGLALWGGWIDINS